MQEWDSKLAARQAQRTARGSAEKADGITPWGLSLLTLQNVFETRMQTRRKSLNENADMTSWAKGLVQSQARFEARMHARNRRQSKRGSAVAQAHHFMQEWDIKLAARKAQRNARSSAHKADGMTPWGLSLLNLQNEFEERMQSRMARGSSSFTQSLT